LVEREVGVELAPNGPTCSAKKRAAAIPDRLLHDAEVLTINGPSDRLRGRRQALNVAANDPTDN